jgi:hypothetical protein
VSNAVLAEPSPNWRTPQYPLKTERTLWTDAEIALARENIATYPAAKAVADNIFKNADKWAAWDDADLRALIPGADVPRAFNVSTEGCPKCGKAIYEANGTYPWIIDIRKPFKIECPICHGVFPDNDFGAYYSGGKQDATLMEGEHADDGWGWVSPEGERYWLVGYANHWLQHTSVVPGIAVLAQAYVLSGDTKYAHKAAVMLDRYAEVYPDYDYHEQSRYGQLQAARGTRYEGKLVNSIWETRVVQRFAAAYDAIWDTLDEDTALHALTGRNGEQTRAHIEANLLEEGIDSYFSKQVRGNFGMHQSALVTATLVRQHGDSEKWLDGIFNLNTGDHSYIGLNYALYNLVFRDGLPFETAPGYNWSWVGNITNIAEALRKTTRNAYDHPKMPTLYNGPLAMYVNDRFTPSVGDSGNVYGGKVAQVADVYQAAYRAFEDDRYLQHLRSFNATGEKSFRTFDSLFEPIIDGTPEPTVPLGSRLLDGYGMAILENPANTVGLSLYYGYKGGHGHYDRLHVELFANGQAMMPDLGYPDFMNAYVPGIFTWSKNTIAHNTVTVDAGRQPNNRPGTVHAFAEGPFARVVDVEASDTYNQTETYRRRVFLIDVDDTRSYVVDVFTVVGGGQHDYSLHGPPGTFERVGGTWADPAPGTLAGPEVAVGALYDAPAMAVDGYTGSYADYRGSGFQHFVNVQRLEGGRWMAEYEHERDASSRLRIHFPRRIDGEVLLAKAQVSPVKFKQLLHYIIQRRTGEAPLTSTFVSVWDPYAEADGPVVTGVTNEATDHGGHIVHVERADGRTDVIGFGVFASDAFYSVHTEQAGTRTRSWAIDTRTVEGEVASVDPITNRVTIQLPKPLADDPSALVGRVMHFVNKHRKTAHPIKAATLDGTVLTVDVADHLTTGRAYITGIDGNRLLTDTSFQFAAIYDGRYAAPKDYSTYLPLIAVKDGALQADGDLPETHPFTPNTNVWLVNVAPGERVYVTGAARE